MATLLDLPEVRARVMRWTVGDYERLIELGAVSRRAELLRGLIVEKMLKSPLHEFPTDNIAENLRRLVREGLLVRQEASLRLADSVPEPDVSMVRGRKEDFRTRHPTTAELVVEVAVSSVALDRENASLYAEAGWRNTGSFWEKASRWRPTAARKTGFIRRGAPTPATRRSPTRPWRMNRSLWQPGSRKAHNLKRSRPPQMMASVARRRIRPRDFRRTESIDTKDLPVTLWPKVPVQPTFNPALTIT